MVLASVCTHSWLFLLLAALFLEVTEKHLCFYRGRSVVTKWGVKLWDVFSFSAVFNHGAHWSLRKLLLASLILTSASGICYVTKDNFTEVWDWDCLLWRLPNTTESASCCSRDNANCLCSASARRQLSWKWYIVQVCHFMQYGHIYWQWEKETEPILRECCKWRAGLLSPLNSASFVLASSGLDGLTFVVHKAIS